MINLVAPSVDPEGAAGLPDEVAASAGARSRERVDAGAGREAGDRRGMVGDDDGGNVTGQGEPEPAAGPPVQARRCDGRQRLDGLGSTRDMGTFGDAPVATWLNGVPIPDGSGSDDPNDGFVSFSDWTGVSRLVETRARWMEGGPAGEPLSVGDFVWSDLSQRAPDVRGCIRVAAGMAVRLLPLAHVLESIGCHAGACVRLEKALAASKVSLDTGREVEARSLEAIAALCAEVLEIGWPAEDPRRGMWDYVASLASHAVEGVACPHDDERVLAEIET